MIHPYWPAVPIMIVYYYATHPTGNYNSWRSKMVIILTSIWSLRLSHNYFRRENWQWGIKEDWRFTDMGSQYGANWWWISFFTIYFSQQIFLMGVTLPYYIIHTIEAPWSIWDVIATAMCLTGIIVAYFADTQLHEFRTKNAELEACGKSVIPVLKAHLWQYSRHPNYVGEQLWWWGLGIFAWSLGQGWAFIGAFGNTLCLAYVTTLVEERMLKQPFRADVYREYQKTTPVWIPWKSSSKLTTQIMFYLFFSALLGATLTQYLFLIGIQYTSAAYSTAFSNLTPVFSFLLALSLRQESVNLRSKSGITKVSGSLICLGRVLLLIFYRGFPVNHTHHGKNSNITAGVDRPRNWILGSVFLVLSILCWAAWFLLQARIGKKYPCKYTTTALMSALGAVQSAILCFAIDRDLGSWILRGSCRFLLYYLL
ncbi:hypothetical protein KSS87_009089 [Heliosperma pusillum]|nr:hypothetical protein KSS87_009089 [Heliosperma pusillum]